MRTIEYHWRGKPEYFDNAMDAVRKGNPGELVSALKQVRGSTYTYTHESGHTIATLAVSNMNYHCRNLNAYHNGIMKIDEPATLRFIENYNEIFGIIIRKFKKWKTATSAEGKTPIDLIKENPFYTGADKPLNQMISVPQKLTV